MRIAIVGNAGSGKSTLARELQSLLSLPLYHLDQYFWKPGWQEPDRAEFEKIHNALCDQDAWIIEGMAIRFASYRFAKADIIIFLDVPRYRCFWRMFKRVVMHFGTVYFSSAPGCPERGPSIKFLTFMWQFKYKQRVMVQRLFEQYKNNKQLYVLTHDNQKKAIIASIVNSIKKD